jgi:hypothetical protein
MLWKSSSRSLFSSFTKLVIPLHKSLVFLFLQNVASSLMSRVKWLGTGFGWVIRFTGLLQTVARINYSATANSNTLQFTIAHTKSCQSAVFSSCCLVMAPNTTVSSASRFKPLLAGDCLTTSLLLATSDHHRLALASDSVLTNWRLAADYSSLNHTLRFLANTTSKT